MPYAILAYHEAGVIEALAESERAGIMDRLMAVHAKHKGKIGPAGRLDFTGTAMTLRGTGEGTVIDGPFAETKEHLLGLYVVNSDDRDEVIGIARDLRHANPTAVYEMRPIPFYLPGIDVPRSEA